MPHSEVDKARLLPNGDIEISLVLPIVVKDVPLVVHAVVTQDAAGGATASALAHTSYLFTPTADDEIVVFPVPRDPNSRAFDPKVGVEARATASYACWSTLDGAAPTTDAAPADGEWTWRIADWG